MRMPDYKNNKKNKIRKLYFDSAHNKTVSMVTVI